MATVLITGANRGIGLAFAQAFARRGDKVVGTARHPDDAGELRATGATVVRLDVADDASVGRLASELQDEPIDLLLHNAGILLRDRLGDLDPATVLRQLDVNAVGALRVVQALLPNLRQAEAPRVVCMTSRMGSIADNTSGAFYGYRASKAALNAIVKSLSLDLHPWPVIALHPGYIRTRMTGGSGDMDPDEAVSRMIQVIDALDAERSGRFFHRDGHELPW